MGSTKNVLKTYHAITNGDMSGDITSPVTSTQFLDNIGIQLNFTGTPTGTFQIQYSADYNQDSQGNVINAGNWITNSLITPTPAASGSADQIYIDLTQISSPWVRVKYVRTSGTGTLNMYITAKMV